jgi:hypothetical protein
MSSKMSSLSGDNRQVVKENSVFPNTASLGSKEIDSAHNMEGREGMTRKTVYGYTVTWCSIHVCSTYKYASHSTRVPDPLY